MATDPYEDFARPHHEIPARHFNRVTLRMLTKRGVSLVGMTYLPNATTGSYANGETGYQVNDNGTSRILTLLQILARAEVRS